MPVISQDSSTDHSSSTASSDLGLTFGEQAQRWLEDLATRKRKPISPASMKAFTSYTRKLNSIISPEINLADVSNGFVKELVTKLCEGNLSPKTVLELVATLKQIARSAVDPDGNQLFPRAWNTSFLDLPTLTKQKQPSVTPKDVERCIKGAASDQERVLYCVLAGSGLRIAEALAIHISGTRDQTSWSPERGAIDVRSSIFNGREIPRVKTLAARRTVDLDPKLSDLIAKFVESNGIQPGDYLFQARGSGRPMHLKTARERLAKHGVPGFHSFRRFFISRRRSLGFPEFLLRSIVGHSEKSTTDDYDKSAEDEEHRKYWARKAGLGFELPELRNPGRPAPLGSAPKPVITPAPAEAASAEPPYVAQTEDLDPFFYQEA